MTRESPSSGTGAGCFSYKTNKEVRIESQCLGITYYILIALLILVLGVIVITAKGYQKKVPPISSVHTKVKGVADADSRIWDTAEYTIPSQGPGSFFVLTNIIKTENQMLGTCPEYPSPKTICSRDDICKKGHADPQSNGIQSGRCMPFNSTIRTCEISAWCPVESERNTPEKNILPEYNISCVYDRVSAPQCPIFRLADIFKEAGENFSQVAVLGGVMGIEINWDCNLDSWSYHCRPKYSFRRLDEKVIDERLYPGYNFRFARYYKSQDGKERRTLIKAYGIRFDIQVYGIGGKFNWIELVLFVGSYLSYFALVTMVIDFLITLYSKRCCNPKRSLKYYEDKKYESAHGPCIAQMLRFVSFMDEDHIVMVDTKCKDRKSLQNTNGKNIQRESVADFSNVLAQCHDSVTVSVAASEARQHNPPLRPPSWCQCQTCPGRSQLEAQLCCRREKGECITNTDMFQKLVLSRETLKFIAQYNKPGLQDKEITSEMLVPWAKKQYIQWRFGSNKDVVDFAIIPSCCERVIGENLTGNVDETSLHEPGTSSSAPKTKPHAPPKKAPPLPKKPRSIIVEGRQV
ncbi:P2X purinoceptor 7 isoform X2 [Ascaphus truei]|uniref:P2X purinoceptor 7 isoform X2 n=1 Tax=Ascaphus truei TaxID=8439 RepID=UPI003F5A3E39